jgi:hypothetical protein
VRGSFYSYGFRPFPQLPADYIGLLQSPGDGVFYRSLTCSTERSTDPTYGYCLPHNLPLLYGVSAFDGYDPLLRSKPPFQKAIMKLFDHPDEGLRAYGIRWCLIHWMLARGQRISESSSNVGECHVTFAFVMQRAHFGKTYDLPSMKDIVQIREVDNVSPLCFREDAPTAPVPVQLDCRGIHADLGGAASAGSVVVNFFKYPDLHAYADGTQIPVAADEWGRMVVDVPAGVQRLDVLYESPWRNALLSSLIPAAMGFLVLGGLMLADKRARLPQTPPANLSAA